jgi:hypothetical protein
MTEAVEKAPDAAIDAMNATLRRMHASKPKPHKSSVLPKKDTKTSVEINSEKTEAGLSKSQDDQRGRP